MATIEKYSIQQISTGGFYSTTGTFGWVIDPDDSSTFDQARYFESRQSAVDFIDTLPADEYSVYCKIVKTE